MPSSPSSQTTNDIPEAVVPIAELMSGFRGPWALCGGWAIDAWLGRHTREHGDIDICVFLQDQGALRDHLDGWQLVLHDANAHDDTSTLWAGRPVALPAHIHARRDIGEVMPARVDAAAEQGFSLDIQFNDQSGDDWILSGQPRLSIPLGNGVQQSPWGLPTVVPEVLLFFKARELRRRDKLDFLALLPSLTQDQRDWLRSAISLVGHPWLSQLSP